ncbi:Chitinase domain-containing protein 1 [Hypsibius exemplaris]|uniref:Chitinase domain-containing protein 1 n=1 Tax=Hypsibius exemplaris TaxID=2072580 RepID=A0A9X6NCE5_HYPEX|nr:Chitinase domain-containing protein 1 [Hypsibius exemplaris]
MKLLCALCILACSGCLTLQVFGHASDASDQNDSTAPRKMLEKKLISSAMEILDIFDYHNQPFSEPADRRVKGFVLGYVTPWNNKGYDRAVKYAQKFTHISPVWLQVHPGEARGEDYVVKGTHDIDNGWVTRIRESNPKIKIVPRFLLEGFDGKSFQALIYDNDKAQSFAVAVAKILKENKLDGAVLEMWKPVSDDGDRKAMRQAIKTIASKLKKDGFQTVLVVPPSGGQNVAGRLRSEDFAFLADSIVAFSVMTYDHPETYSSGGPIAPLKWVSDSLESIVPAAKEKNKRKKLLLGLNHYGYDWSRPKGAEAILSSTYLEQLKKHQPVLQWDEKSGEHSYKYYNEKGIDHLVHFPTLKSVDLRIILANKLGVGIAIWDLGQGLDYFFDLL